MDIVIVGGGYAGLSCALRLAWRARRQRTPARIRLIDPSAHFTERIRLHQVAAGRPPFIREMKDRLARLGVDLVEGTVEHIDRNRRTVHVGGAALRWDRLALAAGSRIAMHVTPGAAENAIALEPQTAAAVRRRLQRLPVGSRVVVVGGGLTAIESASEIAEAFPRLLVHLVSAGPVGGELSAVARAYILEALERKLDIRVHEHCEVSAVSRSRLQTHRGQLSFDACLWTAGFEAPAFVRGMGLEVNARGQVVVDAALKARSDASIYAAGDVASVALDGRPPVPLGCKTALPMGAHAGDNLAAELRGEQPAPFDYALAFHCVSLGRRDGVIQWADDDGRVIERVLTSWTAALFKELVSRTTWWALALEGRGLKVLP